MDGKHPDSIILQRISSCQVFAVARVCHKIKAISEEILFYLVTLEICELQLSTVGDKFQYQSALSYQVF